MQSNLLYLDRQTNRQPTISLSPTKVVSQALVSGIEDDSGIKGGWVQEVSGREEMTPVEDITGSKVRHNGGHDLAVGGREGGGGGRD